MSIDPAHLLSPTILRRLACVSRKKARCPTSVIEWDDQLQIAYTGSIRGIRVFRGGAASFETWVITCGIREIWKALEAECSQKRGANFYRVRKVDKESGDDFSLSSFTDSRPSPGEIAARNDMVDRSMKLLGQKEREVVRGYLLEGKSFEEVGKQIGVTKHRVAQIWQEAIDWVRRVMLSEDSPAVKQQMVDERHLRKCSRRSVGSGLGRVVYDPSAWDWSLNDTEIARRAGCSLSYVGAKRRAMGKPASPYKDRKVYLSEESAA